MSDTILTSNKEDKGAHCDAGRQKLGFPVHTSTCVDEFAKCKRKATFSKYPCMSGQGLTLIMLQMSVNISNLLDVN